MDSSANHTTNNAVASHASSNHSMVPALAAGHVGRQTERERGSYCLNRISALFTTWDLLLLFPTPSFLHLAVHAHRSYLTTVREVVSTEACSCTLCICSHKYLKERIFIISKIALPNNHNSRLPHRRTAAAVAIIALLLLQQCYPPRRSEREREVVSREQKWSHGDRHQPVRSRGLSSSPASAVAPIALALSPRGRHRRLGLHCAAHPQRWRRYDRRAAAAVCARRAATPRAVAECRAGRPGGHNAPQERAGGVFGLRGGSAGTHHVSGASSRVLSGAYVCV